MTAALLRVIRLFNWKIFSGVYDGDLSNLWETGYLNTRGSFFTLIKSIHNLITNRVHTNTFVFYRFEK